MSADATLAGMPLSVPWSVQYSLLKKLQDKMQCFSFKVFINFQFLKKRHSIQFYFYSIAQYNNTVVSKYHLAAGC